MARGPGRDAKVAMQRQLRLLTRLAQADKGWVNRDSLAADLFPGAKSPRDAIARDRRNLEDTGWTIEQRGQGSEMAWRLVDRDPRLSTALTEAQLQQLARAVQVSGREPRELGLPEAVATTDISAPLDDSLRAALNVEEFLHAWHHHCLVTVTYKGRRRQIHVDDVRRTGRGRWRITAREDGVQKRFRVDRCDDIHVAAPGTATPPQPVERDNDPLSIEEGEPITALVRVAPEHEARVVQELGKPSGRDEREDGIHLEIPVTNRWLWRMRLYQLGERVFLTGPPELRTEVREELLSFVGDHR